ncbi:MAG TPA: SagB family peptide dehydrogenase [Acidimicrobiia bacterium]|nr:SagB family peptide dehydrogenase [Acidimicrobiia bacterium]
MNAPDAAAMLHDLTRHGSPTDRSRLVDFQPLDPANRPAPFKRYADLETTPLPTELGEPATPPAIDAVTLARLLFFTGGVTRASSSRAFEERTYFRTAMSAGNLHPVELYVVSTGVAGVPDGVHHFAPLELGLTTLRTGAVTSGSACSLVFTGIPWRTAWKYGERGFRHLYWDAGTMLANLLAVADAHGLDATVWTGFVDDDVARLVGVDGVSELPLALVSIGGRAPVDVSADLPPLDLVVEPISPRPITFPLIVEAQQAGALPNSGAVDDWRAHAIEGRRARAEVEPPLDSVDGSIEHVILQRGSTRIMRPDDASAALLEWGMAVGAGPVPADFVAPGTTLLEHNLAVHGIEGVEPGAYRWRDGDLELVRPGQFRPITQQLCLDQPLGGDSAYTAFHSARLDEVLGALGPRGYRVAQLEAGISSGRLSLAAFALGDGATGLTFFDDPVRRFFATEASCMLVTSVGVPAYRNAAGGRPGSITELNHYGDLMQRLSLQLHRGGR